MIDGARRPGPEPYARQIQHSGWKNDRRIPGLDPFPEPVELGNVDDGHDDVMVQQPSFEPIHRVERSPGSGWCFRRERSGDARPEGRDEGCKRALRARRGQPEADQSDVRARGERARWIDVDRQAGFPPVDRDPLGD